MPREPGDLTHLHREVLAWESIYRFNVSPGQGHPVVGTGVDPVTSRFSGARSTN
jgi:hypothetical protein